MATHIDTNTWKMEWTRYFFNLYLSYLKLI